MANSIRAETAPSYFGKHNRLEQSKPAQTDHQLPGGAGEILPLRRNDLLGGRVSARTLHGGSPANSAPTIIADGRVSFEACSIVHIG